jgi:hypothetical protein
VRTIFLPQVGSQAKALPSDTRKGFDAAKPVTRARLGSDHELFGSLYNQCLNVMIPMYGAVPVAPSHPPFPALTGALQENFMQ